MAALLVLAAFLCFPAVALADEGPAAPDSFDSNIVVLVGEDGGAIAAVDEVSNDFSGLEAFDGVSADVAEGTNDEADELEASDPSDGGKVADAAEEQAIAGPIATNDAATAEDAADDSALASDEGFGENELAGIAKSGSNSDFPLTIDNSKGLVSPVSYEHYYGAGEAGSIDADESASMSGSSDGLIVPASEAVEAEDDLSSPADDAVQDDVAAEKGLSQDGKAVGEDAAASSEKASLSRAVSLPVHEPRIEHGAQMAQTPDRVLTNGPWATEPSPTEDDHAGCGECGCDEPMPSQPDPGVPANRESGMPCAPPSAPTGMGSTPRPEASSSNIAFMAVFPAEESLTAPASSFSLRERSSGKELPSHDGPIRCRSPSIA